MAKLSSDDAEFILNKLQLHVPPSVRLLQTELRDKREWHRCSSNHQDRFQQLLEELQLVDRMMIELMAQAEEALKWQLKQPGNQQSMSKCSPTGPAVGCSDYGWSPESVLMDSQDDTFQPQMQSHSGTHQSTAGSRPNWPDDACVTAGMDRTTAGLDPSNPGTGAVRTMKSHLQDLENEDPDAIFIARRIGKLGFSSDHHLRSYFSKYGEVKHVYVSHSRVRCMHQETFRMRASSLGFVVMSSRNAASQIVADGPQHCVANVNVKVEAFHRRSNWPVDDASNFGGIHSGEVLRDEAAQSESCPAGCPHGQDPTHLAGTVNGAEPLVWSAMPSMSSPLRFSERDLRSALPDCYED